MMIFRHLMVCYFYCGDGGCGCQALLHPSLDECHGWEAQLVEVPPSSPSITHHKKCRGLTA